MNLELYKRYLRENTHMLAEELDRTRVRSLSCEQMTTRRKWKTLYMAALELHLGRK